MTSFNGANNHNFEDLLTSIRNGITDTGMPRHQGPSSPLVPLSRRDAGMQEEHAEFELPAIFKPGHQAAPDKPNLFGRLSDALKPTASSPEPERTRTVIRFEPAAAGRMIEPPQPTTMALPSRPESQPQPDPVVGVEAENIHVKREMPSFFDTRINKLGELSRETRASKPVDPPPAPAPQSLSVQPPQLLQRATEMTGQSNAGAAPAAADDVAAQLLRPILQQWLTDNMPKIVEKALRSEAGEAMAPNGSAQNRRKPGT